MPRISAASVRLEYPSEDFAQMRFLQFFQRNQRADLRQMFIGGSSRRPF